MHIESESLGRERWGNNLQALLSPRSVAVIGASDNPDKIGGRPVDYLMRFGFAGSVYPINPSRQTVQGLVCYPNLTALPGPVDVALIVVPGPSAVEAVEQCALSGVRAAVVLTSGFAEMSSEGRLAQERMASVAREAGMRLMGPNCQGITNFSNGTVLTFSTMYLEQPPSDGPIAIVSQSGSMSQVPYAMLRSRGFGIRYCVATGNETDVSACEVAAAIASDETVRLVLLYLETVRETKWLRELGIIAAERLLPVVALKAGSTGPGQSAAASHTAGLANEDRVVNAFLEELGIYRAADARELVAGVDLFVRDEWTPRARRIAVVSNSGASCVQAADHIVTTKQQLARLRADTVQRIKAVLPPFATGHNPIDLTGALLGNPALLARVLNLLSEDLEFDSLLLALPVLGHGYDTSALASAAAQFAATGRPTVVVTVNPPEEREFRSHGLPVFATEVEAVSALAQWSTWHERVAVAASRLSGTIPSEEGSKSDGVRSERETLDEAESMELLAEFGVPVIRHYLCTDADSAVHAFHEFDAPVVAKGCSRKAMHKSELGLVALGLDTEEEVREAFVRIIANLKSVDPRSRGVMISPVVVGRELMIGAQIDPVFGPTVVVGNGGLAVEVLPDVAVLFPPVEVVDVFRAIDRLRVAPLLRGIRNTPGVDLDSLAKAVIGVSRLITAPKSVAEVDVNPLIVGPEGAGCVAVDALVRLFVPSATPVTSRRVTRVGSES
jgi:acyl-CoA synthetase (NDP forming)